MFQKYMERDFHSASHPASRIWTHFRSIKIYSGGRSLCQNPQLRPQRTQAGRDCCFIRHRASCAEDVAFAIGGTGRNRTIATQIFSLLLYLLSYGPIYKAQMKYLLELNQRQIV